MKKLLLLLVFTGCTIQVQPAPELITTVNNQAAVLKVHTDVLAQIASYVDELQQKGVLPKPEGKKK